MFLFGFLNPVKFCCSLILFRLVIKSFFFGFDESLKFYYSGVKIIFKKSYSVFIDFTDFI